MKAILTAMLFAAVVSSPASAEQLDGFETKDYGLGTNWCGKWCLRPPQRPR